MASLRPFFYIFLSISFAVGCSDVSFKSKPSKTCVEYVDALGSKSCTPSSDGFNLFSYTVQVGKVDILFIDDNSGSMYVEQVKMADQFPNFIQSLNSLDFQIAIATTDISASPNNSTPRDVNGNGAFQDGKFLSFPNSSKVLSKSSGSLTNIENYFKTTVKRPESLSCEQNGYNRAYCPSSDERGVYAIIKAMERKEASFFRNDAHLAVVILSDEDERSDGPEGTIRVPYDFEDYDRPETLVTKFGELLGPAKSLSVHAIVTNDSTCLSQQSSQPGGVRGFIGSTYMQLANPSSSLKALGNIVNGVVGSICSSNYTQEMGSIAAKISQNVNSIQLVCQPAVINGASSLTVTFDRDPGFNVNYNVDSGNRLTFSPAIPAGYRVNVEYKCPRNI